MAKRKRQWREGLAAALASGVLVALAYPATSWWPLALCGYVPLLAWLEVRRPSVRQALFAGWLAGTVLHLAVFPWVRFTMQEMSGLGPVVSALVLGLYGLSMGLHQALWAAVIAWTARETSEASEASLATRAVRAAEIAALLIAVEMVVPFVFPWYLGNALYVAPTLLQAADVFGIIGLSGLAGWCNAWLAASRPWQSRRNGLHAAAGVAIMTGLWWGYGLARMATIEAAVVEKRLVAAVVQANVQLAEKKAENARARLPMLDRLERLTLAMKLDDVDLVIWPEGALPFFFVPLEVDDDRPGIRSRAPPILLETTRRARQFASKLGRPLLFGALRRTDKLWREPVRNSAVLMDGERRVAAYDKQILVPFGEYLPGTSVIPSLAGAIKGISNLAAGEQPGRMRVAGVELLVTICYEALFPAAVRAQGLGADVLINLTNDVWFGKTNAAELHLMVQTPRAVELRRPLIRSTASGITALINDRGQILERAPIDVEATRKMVAEVRATASPWRLWGPWPLWLLVAGVFARLGLVAARRHRQRATP